MQRFFGMMPAGLVKILRPVALNNGETGSLGKVNIQAGNEGWTIMFADSSTEYNDIVGTPEENFQRAMLVVKKYFPNADENTPVKQLPDLDPVEECCDECCDEEVSEEHTESSDLPEPTEYLEGNVLRIFTLVFDCSRIIVIAPHLHAVVELFNIKHNNDEDWLSITDDRVYYHYSGRSIERCEVTVEPLDYRGSVICMESH